MVCYARSTPPTLQGRSVLAAFALLLACCAPVRAAEADGSRCPDTMPSTPLTLRETLARALCSSPATREAGAQALAAAAEADGQRLEGRPDAQLALFAGHGRDREVVGGWRSRGAGTVHDVALDLRWLLHDFGRREAALDSADQLVLAADAQRDQVLQAVWIEAATAFHATLEAQARVDLLQASARDLEALVTEARARAAAPPTRPPVVDDDHDDGDEDDDSDPRDEGDAGGPAPVAAAPFDPLDELQALNSLEHLRLSLVQGKLDLALARGQLAALIGLDPAASPALQVSDALEVDGARQLDAARAVERALRDHPGLKAARARERASAAAAQAARRAGHPSISAVAGWRHGRDGFGDRTRQQVVGLELTLPLLDAPSRRARERQAWAAHRSAEADRAETERGVRVEAWTGVQQVIGQLRLHDQVLKVHAAAHALLAAETRAFRRGDSDMFDVLDARDGLDEAALALLDTRIELRLARLRLAAALGRLSDGTD